MCAGICTKSTLSCKRNTVANISLPLRQLIGIYTGGRHLLQELTVDNFVPNDTYLNAHHNVALISGPNTSGKSVYLKQVVYTDIPALPARRNRASWLYL